VWVRVWGVGEWREVYWRSLPIRSTEFITCVWVRRLGVTRSARPHTLAYTGRPGVALDLKTLA
jgi:hypothetical protein